MAYSCCKVPLISFHNGYQIPQIGLGTWQVKACQVAKIVQEAIDVGYRHIDCALYYNNEDGVGKGIAAKLADRRKKLKRENLFITSKLWNTHHNPNLVECAIKHTLRDLRLKYLDLYLMNWPMAYKGGDNLLPRDINNDMLYGNIDIIDTWRAMENLVCKGYTRSIGVSNFNYRQLDRLIKQAKIVPVVNQVECHPFLNQQKMMEFCACHKIIVACSSPLGAPNRPGKKNKKPVLLHHHTIEGLAKKHNRSVAQIVIKYQVQRGNVVIPKTTSPWRLKENICIFDFQLSREDMEKLHRLNNGVRYITMRGDRKHPEYPFKLKH